MSIILFNTSGKGELKIFGGDYLEFRSLKQILDPTDGHSDFQIRITHPRAEPVSYPVPHTPATRIVAPGMA